MLPVNPAPQQKRESGRALSGSNSQVLLSREFSGLFSLDKRNPALLRERGLPICWKIEKPLEAWVGREEK